MLKNILFIISFAYLISCTSETKHTKVSIKDRNILVNNNPYLIKGICYHPVNKGEQTRTFEFLEKDLVLMTKAGINTIRVYEPIDDIKILDKIHIAGLKIIIGFGYDQNGINDIKSGSFIDYVNKFKTHKAILMWELGNEYNYHPEWFSGDIKNWYTSMNNASKLIHLNDSSHPVSTAHGELPNSLALKMSPNIDVWGMNVYRWDNPATIFSEWEAISQKPMYLSEAGGDSYMTIAADGFDKGKNENAQAVANSNILTATFENQNICSGVTLFSFLDGWWKAGNPSSQDPGGWAPKSSGVPFDGSPNEEYWGIVDINRNLKETYHIVKEKYIGLSEKQ